MTSFSAAVRKEPINTEDTRNSENNNRESAATFSSKKSKRQIKKTSI